jgi:type II secretion system protein D
VTFAETKPKFIPLNNLNASLLTTRISAMLQGITSKQTPPLIASDPRLNMLIVAGTPADVSRVAEIVKTLDVPGNGNLVSKVVKLENAEAGPLTTTLTPLLSEAGKMYADARTNSILILDSTQSINRLMPFIKQFDSGESRESFVVKVIQVKTANTNAIFNPLNTYVQQLSTSKGSSQRSRPQVMVDASTQSIIVIGREADVKDILRIAEELDKLQWQGQEPEFIHVNNAIPSTVAVSVKALLPSITKGGVSVQVIPDDRTSTLIVIAQPSDIALVKGIIEKLDVKDAGDLITKIIPIKSSMASSIYSAIYTLISKRGSLSQDANSNSIILRDTAASVEFIEKIIQDLDTSEAAAAWVTEVRTLRQIDPTTVATMLTNIGTQLSFKKGRTRPQSYAYPEPSSSSVILIGASEEVKADLEMIDRLEAAGQVGGKVRLFFLKYTKAKALQSQLTQVFTSVRRTAGVQPTVVISDDFTNSLIAIGSELDLSRLDELVAKLDIPNAAGLEVEIFPLVGVSASILASNLQLALSGPKGTLFADTNSNSLVVVDTPDAISRISKVIKELGQRGGGITAKVHKLEHGLASNLFAPINSYLTTQATRAGRPTQVVLFQEPAANALVILGPTNEVRSLQALIRTLDTEEMAALEPKVFPLKYVRATALQPQFALLYPQTTLTGIRPIVVAEDTTNTLIVVAPDADLKRIEGIINQIDSADATGLETRVYQIKYSSAERMATNFRPPLISARGRAFAAGGTNTLVIIDTPEVQERLKEFIDRIDLGRGQVVSEVRRLENTSVATLATPLQQFLTHQAQTKGLTQALTQIISDQTSNSVIIYGPSDEVELAKHLIDQLDAESLFEREVKIFPLKRAQAQATVSTLTQLLSIDRKGTGTNAPRVVAEPESNSLIVIASKADLARAEELLKTLDQTDITGVETRVFRLKNADPKVLATNLKPMVGNPAKLLPDAVSNSIFYTDTTANLDRLGKLITQLDTVGGNTGIKTVVQPLRNTTAASVDFALSDFARYFSEKKERRDRPLTRVTADAATNSVLIIGPSDEVDQMMAILKELDRDNLREREPKIYFLKQAQAQALGGQLSLLMASLTQGPAGGSPNAPRIIPNPESNSLLVLATPADRAIIDGLILALDSEDGGFRKPKVLRLRNADATALVASLRPTIGPIASIAAHPDSNSVIYADTPANVEKLFALIEQLDRESRPEDIASEIVTLENSKAGAITEPLQKIITQLSTSRQRKNKVPLQAFADPDANAVVIVGASEEVSQIGKIVRELDSESLSERKPEIFILEYARSADLATELDKLFLQTARFGTAPKIVADKWANALLVIADPRDMDWIRRLIKELDTREGRKRVVQIFVLENADASILAQRLQNLLVPGSDTSGGRRNPYDYYGYYGGSGRRSETLTEGQVSIIADQRLNALVVTAEPQDMSQVSELIDALDIESPNIEEPRVYHIQHGEAETLAETLQNLFTDTDYQRGNYYGAAREVNVSSLSGKVRVSADPVTNSIIVMASSPRAFDVVEEMLKKLDQPSVQAGQTSIIPVRNALAKDLQKLLSALFKQEDTTRTQGQRRGFFFDPFFGSSSGGGGGAGSFSNLVGKVKIEADTRTNSLLVITPELYRASVERLVASLDTPTNQVLLEVLIVEVALGNEEDKGIQWGVDPTTGDVGRISVSNDEILTFDNDRSDLFNPNTFGNTLFNSAAENLQFFSLNRAKFDAVINFLETCRNVNVQSRPNILTADNRKAKIFVGKDFPYVKSISTSGNFVNTSIEYKKLGLDLTVTPHINSATTVSLVVNLKDGAIDPTVPALTGTAFTFTNREISTQLVVNNHHTAILAGVISEKVSDQIHQVPVLHRLPYLGNWLFKNTDRSKEKVELLTFITPFILRSRADVIMATQMTQKKSGAQPLQNLDVVNGDWPEVYADDPKDPFETPPKPPLPPRRR